MYARNSRLASHLTFFIVGYTTSSTMSARTSTLLLLAVTCLQSVPAVHSLTNYANDFIDPAYVVSKNFSVKTTRAQSTILDWADATIEGGPWSKSLIAMVTCRRANK